MVLYFSGTGNSRFAAKKIAEATGDEIVSINQRIKNGDYSPVNSDKPLVFVGPVYAGRLPRVMDQYLGKVEFVGNREAYFVATCAATPWQTGNYVRKMCEKKRFALLGFQSVVMPQGYIAGGGTQPKEVNDRILKEAEPKIEKMAQLIRDGRTFPKEQPGKAMMSKVLNPMMYAMMINAKGFTVTDRCAGCGKCVERCPLNNIKLVGGKPSWGKECTHCMACIAGCPKEAVEYGKKTQGKPRYYLGEE